MTRSAASLDALLSFALRLADAADAQTLGRYEQRAFTVGRKADRSEVTEADRLCESTLGDLVLDAHPSHAFFGEEHGWRGSPDAPWQWIVDPIDGTSNFVRGIPVWASLIALTLHGEAVVGVVSAPALRRRWWGGRGLGAFVDGHPMRRSDVDALAQAQVSLTYNDGWDACGGTDALVSLGRDAYRARGFGDFWQHMLVAEGAIDVAVDAIGLKPWDVAAVKIIVEEAGGVLTDRHGAVTHMSDSAVSTNGLLHAEVLRRLAAAQRPNAAAGSGVNS